MESGKSIENNVDVVEVRKNLYDIFKQNVDKNRSHPLVIFHGKHASYYSILSMVDSMAESLKRKFSISRGDIVGIALPLSPQFFISFLALQKIGGVAVPLDPALTTLELQNIRKLIHIKAMFCLNSTDLNISKDSGIESVILTRIQDFLPFEKAVATTAKHPSAYGRRISSELNKARFAELIYEAKGEQEQVDPEKEPAVALISPSRSGELQAMFFTSSNLVSSAVAISRNLPPLKGRFRIGSVLPPFVPASFQFSVVLPLFLGGTVTAVLERNNYYKLFHLCSLFDCDYMLTSPYDLNRILEDGLPNLAIRSMKGILCNSYLLNDLMREKMEKTYGTHVIEYYGIPEMMGITHMQSPDRLKRKLGSPGFPIYGVEARIVEEKTHAPTPMGSTGELLVNGPQLCRNFEPKHEEMEDYYYDHFFDSGDLARIDEDGSYFIEDRRREAIVSEGILVSSSEIEQAISLVEGVSEVAVVGIGNNKGQEEILAVVSAGKETSGLSSKILSSCRRILSSYKVPQKIEFREELPKSMAGKILKRQIIEENEKKIQ